MRLIKQEPLSRLDPIIEPVEFEMLIGVRLMDGELACMGNDPMFTMLYRPIAFRVTQRVLSPIRGELLN